MSVFWPVKLRELENGLLTNYHFSRGTVLREQKVGATGIVRNSSSIVLHLSRGKCSAIEHGFPTISYSKSVLKSRGRDQRERAGRPSPRQEVEFDLKVQELKGKVRYKGQGQCDL